MIFEIIIVVMIYIGIFKSVKNAIKTIIVILFFSFLYGQSNKRDYDEELRYQNEAINSLKDEIKSLKSKIKKTETRENLRLKEFPQ